MYILCHRRCQFGSLVVVLEAAPSILVVGEADDLWARQHRVDHSANSHGFFCADSSLEDADGRAVLAYPEPEADLELLAWNFQEVSIEDTRLHGHDAVVLHCDAILLLGTTPRGKRHVVHGVVLGKGALDEAWVESSGGVLEAVGYDFVDVGGSDAQEQLLFDWQGVLDSVAEAFGDSLYSEDGLRREVNEDVLYQLAGLEDSLHCGGCGGFLCGWHGCG